MRPERLRTPSYRSEHRERLPNESAAQSGDGELVFECGQILFEIGKTHLLVCAVFTHAGHSRQRHHMPRCNHCDAHVSENFARVFANEDGHLHACPNCAANVGIAEVSKDRARRA